MGRKRREPIDEEILQYTSTGQFVRSYASLKAAADYLGLKEHLIYNSIALRKLCYEFAFIYRSEIPRIPETLDVKAFRPHRSYEQAPEKVASKTAAAREEYFNRRRKRVVELLYQENLPVNVLYGKMKGAKEAQRVSEGSVFVNRILLQQPAERIVEVIKREMQRGVIEPYKFTVQMKNIKKMSVGGLDFVKLSDGILHIETPSWKHVRIMGKKQCWTCGKYKEPEAFIRSQTTGDGLTHGCRACIERAEFLWGRGLRERNKDRLAKLFPLDRIAGIPASQGNF